MKTTRTGRLVGSRKSVFANISNDSYARLQRRAPASHLSAAKYTGVALDFYMDIEEAYGTPMTEEIRASLLRQAVRQGEIVKKALK